MTGSIQGVSSGVITSRNQRRAFEDEALIKERRDAVLTAVRNREQSGPLEDEALIIERREAVLTAARNGRPPLADEGLVQEKIERGIRRDREIRDHNQRYDRHTREVHANDTTSRGALDVDA